MEQEIGLSCFTGVIPPGIWRDIELTGTVQHGNMSVS